GRDDCRGAGEGQPADVGQAGRLARLLGDGGRQGGRDRDLRPPEERAAGGVAHAGVRADGREPLRPGRVRVPGVEGPDGPGEAGQGRPPEAPVRDPGPSRGCQGGEGGGPFRRVRQGLTAVVGSARHRYPDNSRRGGRVVECVGLENRYSRKAIGGSNPPLSARKPRSTSRGFAFAPLSCRQTRHLSTSTSTCPARPSTLTPTSRPCCSSRTSTDASPTRSRRISTTFRNSGNSG